MRDKPRIYVALPVMDEKELLPVCLDCISRQTYPNYRIVICVNQPEIYWADPEKVYICHNNNYTLDFLHRQRAENITVIDKSSVGQGWEGNKVGVGWARKTVMDAISAMAEEEDIIISLDADTTFPENYFKSVADLFCGTKMVAALSNPYYHRLTGREAEDRAILHYEIYMRNYAINLLLIRSPYAFTALGSAMALNVSAYRAIGGMTPKLSGEDFYFLQKLKKYGKVFIHNSEKVFPAARFSDRVFFGTGPAMIKGNAGNWESYPVYHHSLFSEIKKTCESFPDLFIKDVETPMSAFLREQFNDENIWQPLRENAATVKQFVRACHEKVDGLRILQYLKQRQQQSEQKDESCLLFNIENVFSRMLPLKENIDLKYFDLMKSPVSALDDVRNYLAEVEDGLQRKEMIL